MDYTYCDSTISARPGTAIAETNDSNTNRIGFSSMMLIGRQSELVSKYVGIINGSLVTRTHRDRAGGDMDHSEAIVHGGGHVFQVELGSVM